MKAEYKNNRVEKSHNPYFTGNSFAIGELAITDDYFKQSQSLFYWKLLCNEIKNMLFEAFIKVTILILLETPLQLNTSIKSPILKKGHNPYFTGNSFAI